MSASTAEYSTPLDILNRALDIIGAQQLLTYTDDAPQNRLTTIYDKLRLYELRRNAWTFAIRRTTIRAISTTSLKITYPAYNAATTYAIGDIVISGGQLWVSRIASNTGNTPGAYATTFTPLPWDRFFGPMWCDQWASTTVLGANNVPVGGYNAGEMAYILAATAGTAPTLYQSLISSNTQTPNAVDAWVSGNVYMTGAVVSKGGVNYQSKVDFNINQDPATATAYWTTTVTNPLVSGSWRSVTGATLAVPIIPWPVQSGPVEDSNTRNAYPLPSGYLRRVNQKPSAGKIPLLGAPTNLLQMDWEFDAGFIVTRESAPISFRFGADVLDVTLFDPMFCEGLAASLGMSATEFLTQAPEKKAYATSLYGHVMGEARISNAIEQGAEMPPLDTWISSRY